MHLLTLIWITFSLRALSSLAVRVSALAITGMILTRWCSCLINSISSGFSLGHAGEHSIKWVCHPYIGSATALPDKACATHLPMSTRIDEVQARVDSMVLNVPAVEARFITQVLVVLFIDIVDNGLPAEKQQQLSMQEKKMTIHLYHALLSTASPKPGVSTTVSRNLTPFSSMSTVVASMLTVCLMRSTWENMEWQSVDTRTTW